MSFPETQRKSPYQGLIPYGEADAPFFFGREKETRMIIANLFGARLTLLYGASGVGKSSVLRAGVTHQLSERDDLLVLFFNAWQSNPVTDLKQAVADCADLAGHEGWRRVLSRLPPDRPVSLSEFLTICASELNRRLMIILDQFEEYFLYHPQDDEFAAEFPGAVTQTDAPVSFLISIREDSLAKLDRFEGRIPSLFDNYLRIEHLNRASARDAIVKPLEQYNTRRASHELPMTIEMTLVEEVLKQVETGQVILGEAGRGVVKTETTEAQIETPFLQMVMTRLWGDELRADSRVLRLDTLTRLGDHKTGEKGAERIVRTHLDETMKALSPERQDIAAEVFHYLVTPSGTKIAHTIPDLAEYAKLPRAELAPAMDELTGGDTRILRGVEPPSDQPGESRYEIFHDVLAPAILDWRSRYVQGRELSGQQEKLAAERQRTSRLRLALVRLAMLLVVMMGLTAYAYQQRHKAAKASKEAAEAREKTISQGLIAINLKEEAVEARIDETNALFWAEEQTNKANTQAALALKREAEAKRQTARAEVERLRAVRLMNVANDARLRCLESCSAK